MKHNMFLAALCVATICFSDVIIAQENTTNEQKAILVTGASTGIGRHIAETLAAGYPKEGEVMVREAMRLNPFFPNYYLVEGI